MLKLNNVIHKIITTEKVTKDTTNSYALKVSLKASKDAIAQAVESYFKVDVLDVRTIVVPGRTKRAARTYRQYRIPSWKKAIVKVKDGQKIQIEEKKEKEEIKKSKKKESKE